MKKCNAFVVAAGFGERLRPITNHIPKPLLPLAGKPVIESVLERLCTLEAKQIGINMHYKWQMISDWASSSPFSDAITLFREDTLLGTGGALRNAASMLSDSTFIVHNADVVSDIDLHLLLEIHEASGNLATLAIQDCPAFNNVWIDDAGKLRAVGRSVSAGLQNVRAVAFTGIAIYSPEFLNFLPGGESNVVNAWIRAITDGHSIATVDVTGCLWTDIGSPLSYAEAVTSALTSAGEQFYIGSSVECPLIMQLDGWAVLESGCSIAEQTSIKRSIILPGTIVTAGSELKDVIAGPDYTVSIRNVSEQQPKGAEICNSLFLKDYSGSSEISLIGFGGSDRAYYRIHTPERSCVFLKSAVDDPDYTRQIIYTDFFRRHKVPVPELLAKEVKEGVAVFEDLGDLTLYVWLKCRRDQEAIEMVYQRVLDTLITLHTHATEYVSECPLLQSRLFDYEHLRWETDYFISRFVRGVKGIGTEETIDIHGGLEQDFDRLAKVVDSYRKTILHRDFQSQNIMIKDAAVPRIIDYQGARMGPPAYDVASILWDPYHDLDTAMRGRLVGYYFSGVRKYQGSSPDEAEFAQSLLLCRLQRHMQTLGAYGFLSKVKGKTYFLKHVPSALKHLTEEIERVKTEYPFLSVLVTLLNDKK